MKKLKIDTDNLLGKQFGKLRVLALSPDTDDFGKLQWLCKCSCGTVVEVLGDYLINGTITACDYYRHTEKINHDKRGNPANMLGRRSGKLTVISSTFERDPNNGSIKWKCQCDCGNITYVSTTHLKNRTVRSCGCLRSMCHKKNRYIKHQDSYIVYDDKGDKFTIDAEDKKKIDTNYWTHHGNEKQFYSSRRENQDRLPLWRVILNDYSPDSKITFINKDKSDYRKSNLKYTF